MLKNWGKNKEKKRRECLKNNWWTNRASSRAALGLQNLPLLSIFGSISLGGEEEEKDGVDEVGCEREGAFDF